MNILSSDKTRMIEQAKFTYSPLGKAFEKQIKTTESQSKKQTKATEEHGKQLAKSNAFVFHSLNLLRREWMQ